jgi:alkylhydroperoxidase/carboxymuconolactone decarboxylase family protein YurZ
MSDKIDQEKRQRGLDTMDVVYGPNASKMMSGLMGSPYVAETVDHLFADIWSRPHLSVRDRRLLVIGATAMLGRPDLIEVQIAGAIVNGELDDNALDEVVLQLGYYCGWGNAQAVQRGIAAAKARAQTMRAEKD